MSITAPPDKTSTPRKPRRARPAPPRVVGPMTYEEYARFDLAADRKHELIEGKVVQMAGASQEHNLLASSTLRLIGNALDAAGLTYDVYASDQAVYANRQNALYPDITVAPYAAHLDEKDRLINPVVIVEVLSDSTRAYDSDEKFKAYQTIASFRHYILISQEQVFVTHYRKNAEGIWEIAGMYSDLTDTLNLALDDATITVSVGDMYRRVSFEEA